MSRCGECPSWVKEKCNENLVYDECIDMLQDILYELPSRPNGEWLKSEIVETWVGAFDKDTPNTFQSHKCSNCGFKTGTWTPNYCPNCGTHMEGANDDI